jgi:hypothetical protein
VAIICQALRWMQGSWQMQHDAPHRGLYPGAELQEVLAQSADLGA